MEVEVSDHDHSSPTTSSDEEEEEEPWEGRTFFDFESDDSIPNLTVKTFLQDCYQHPKILFHKDFQFFRSYLCEVGLNFEMPVDAPFLENHENNTFCVDRGDKWLQQLKERVYPENTQKFYWASIIPVKRKRDLGMVIFKWEPLPMSIHFLDVYITFCRSKSQIVTESGEAIGQNVENVDDYIEDFMRIYDPSRNIDVEERLNDSKKAIAYRRENNLQPPSRTDLLYLFRRQPRPVANLSPRSSKAASKLKPGAGKRRESTSSSSESDAGTGNESDSSSASSKSSEGSDWADCKGLNNVKSHRKTKKRKSRHRAGTKRVNGVINRSVASHSNPRKKIRLKYEIKIILERCAVPVKSNGTVRTPSPAPSPTIEDSFESVAPAMSPETITKPTISTVPNGILKKPSAIIITDTEGTTLPSAVSNESRNVEVLHTPKDTETNSSSLVDVEEETMKVSSTTVEENDQTLTEASCTLSVANIDSSATTKPMNGMKDPLSCRKVAKKSQTKSTKFPCDICWFGKAFPTQKLLDKHMNTAHASRKRELITCKCGLRVKKTSIEFHQRFCKTTIVKLTS